MDEKYEPVWENIYPKNSVLKGKTKKVTSDLLAAIALLGPCTTFDIANLVFQKETKSPHVALPYLEAKTRAGVYKNRIRTRYSNGKKHPGLVSQDFVKEVGKKNNVKKTYPPLYFLTLKGCLLALGFKFTKSELETFLENAAKHYLVFAYFVKVIRKTSYTFFTAHFLYPIKYLIKNNKITLDKDLDFNLSTVLIAEMIGAEIYKELEKKVFWYNKFEFEGHKMKSFEHYTKHYISMMECTWYDNRSKERWLRNMVRYFYPDPNDFDYFISHQDLNYDYSFLYKLMDRIHHGYWLALDYPVPPRYTQRLSLPKIRKQK